MRRRWTRLSVRVRGARAPRPVRARSRRRSAGPCGVAVPRSPSPASASAHAAVRAAFRKTPPLSVATLTPASSRSAATTSTTRPTTAAVESRADEPWLDAGERVCRRGCDDRSLRRLPAPKRSRRRRRMAARASRAPSRPARRTRRVGRRRRSTRPRRTAGPCSTCRHAAEPGLELPVEQRELVVWARTHARGAADPTRPLRSAGVTAPSGRGCGRRRRRRAGRRTRGGRAARRPRSRPAGTRRPRPRRRRRSRFRRRRLRARVGQTAHRARPSSTRRGRGGAAPPRPGDLPRGAAPTAATGTPDAGRRRSTCGHDAGRASPGAPRRSSNAARVARSSMSPMCAGHPGNAALGQAERVLEVAADAERRRAVERQR